jgi:hypothetical protein
MRRRTFLTALLTPLLPIEKLAPVIVPKTPTIVPLKDMAWMMPMIQRTMPELIMADLIKVQPMDGPSGQVFAMTIKYKPTFMQSLRTWVRKQAA